MSQVREARLFRNGRNQAVRIPKEFELPGDTVTMRREGTCLIIEPSKEKSFESLLNFLAQAREEAEPGELDIGDIPEPEIPLDPVNL